MGREPKEPDYYNPEKARVYRSNFPERDPEGRTWAERMADWRREHPEYRLRSREYVRKSKLVAKLGLKQELKKRGIADEEIRRFLRLLSCEEVKRTALCLRYWSLIAEDRSVTLELLLEHICGAARVSNEDCG